MLAILRRLVARCQIERACPGKAGRFAEAFSRLVTILFSVVFAVGLSQINNVAKPFDGFVLGVAYLAILLSWYGYHYGITVGPAESNWLLHVCDILILLCYWFLINWRSPFAFNAGMYAAIFLLYTSWEFVRHLEGNWPGGKSAAGVNLLFFVITLFITLVQLLVPQVRYATLAIILCMLPIYRFWAIPSVYRLARRRELPTAAVGAGAKLDTAQLVERAREAQSRALAPLSGYRVGAAVLGSNRKIYAGTNVEFQNYSNTIHAEEAALAAAVADGEHTPIAVAVATTGSEIAWPCGMCLQSLYELGGKDLLVVASNGSETQQKPVGDLLPYGFTLEGERA